MSDELYEVAFSGEIAEGADPEAVKAKVGAMFKADANKLAHLFSGKRVVIKKNIDQATAQKYKTALSNAGALCEVKPVGGVTTEVDKAPSPPQPQEPVQTTNASSSASTKSGTSGEGNAPAAPQTDPLGITASDISELSVSVAPVGSQMQDDIKEVSAPDVDISELDMAPAGSDLGQVRKGDEPPPPDTDGLSLVDS